MVTRLLDKKMFREIRNNWKQYLAVILIACLSVTLFTGLLANYLTFNKRLNDAYTKSNMGDCFITVSKTDDSFDSFLNSYNYEYEKRTYLQGFYNSSSVSIIVPTKEEISIPEETSLNRNINQNDVLIDEKMANSLNLKTGDSILIKINGVSTLEFTITGTMIHPESLESSAVGTYLLYIGKDVFNEELDQKLGIFSFDISSICNQYVIKTSDSSTCLDLIDNYFSEERDINLIYSFDRASLPSNLTIEADVIQAKKLMYVFPVIFYLVGILIILTTISQLINRDLTNIGIMKALGLSKKEILFHYLKLSVVLCLIGGIIGIIIGPLIIPNVMNQKYNILYYLPKASTSLFEPSYLISVGFLLIIAILTCILCCHHELKRVPAESLRGSNNCNMHHLLIEKFNKAFSKIALSIRMAFRNMKRKISRSIMVIIGTLGCSALLLCGYGIEDTLYYGIDRELDSQITYDISATYSSSGNHENDIKSYSNVSNVLEYTYLSINATNDKSVKTYLYILDNKSDIFKVDWDTSSGAMISKKIANDINAKVGDTITYVYDNNVYHTKIAKIEEFSFSQGIFMYKEDSLIESNPNKAWINVTDYNSLKETSDLILNESYISQVMSIDDFRVRVDNALSSIKLMTLTVKIFAILLALVVLYNLAQLNFKERIRDIATLKVLGFNKAEIGFSLVFEILILTLVGSLIGLLFGYPIMVLVLSINENPFLTYVYHINSISYIYTVLITCGTSIVINIFLANLTGKVKMVESLKSVE